MKYKYRRKIIIICKFAIIIFYYLLQFAKVKYSRHEEGITNFGLRVKELRQKKGISQEQLAWETGLEFSQINRIENGKINTSISNIFIIAAALRVNPSELLEFT